MKTIPAKLFIVGLGPGNSELLPPLAADTLLSCEVIVGYSAYIDLLCPSLKEGKILISTGMTEEIARVQAALDSAAGGVPTALIASGDPGIYALAGLAFELNALRGAGGSCGSCGSCESCEQGEPVEIEVVPGIPALCAAAALLGAPLGHDFAVISLSNRLTPWPLIKKRVALALEGDFVIVLYNPRSKSRADFLAEVLDGARNYVSKNYTDQGVATRPVGIVRNAFRAEQEVTITTLQNADAQKADMFSLVIIGSSSSKILNGKFVTPRGYLNKYDV